METHLADWIRESARGREADAILRACVHCGFCLATCPTYQLLGDELDSPRGRIYQIKQVLEGAAATRETQVHLDRCLTCRSCESTCPSGVEYGHLVDIGRAVVDERVSRPMLERAYRWLIREGVTRSWLFGAALRTGRSLSWALPKSLRAKIGSARPAGSWPTRTHARKVLLVTGCVQPAMLSSIDAATARVLDTVGIQVVTARSAGCCGAIRHHLDDQAGARESIRRNIDAWWPFVESGEVEAILVNASGCSAMVKEYAHMMQGESGYGEKARRIVAVARDLSELLPGEMAALTSKTRTPATRRIAFHPPCTLQHGLKIQGVIEQLLQSMGAELVPVPDAHLCCGSAGSYSLLQPQVSGRLRSGKLEALLLHGPDEVLSANIGCIAHLQEATSVPVRHWIEWIDEAVAGRPDVPHCTS